MYVQVRYLKIGTRVSHEFHGQIGLDLLDPRSCLGIWALAEWRWGFFLFAVPLIPNARSVNFAYTFNFL
jgi:hypothetical protein